MLFERRCYTLKFGCTQAFWDAQRERGFALVQPILDRVVGYFSATTGAHDQIVHLYRYDGYEDWRERLHGLYGVKELQRYFQTVRRLMTAQDNCFLAPAPITELNPLWGQGRDWLPDIAGGRPRPFELSPETIVEETVTQLHPGGLPFYWEAYALCDLRPSSTNLSHLIGCFYTLVGRFHQVVHYRAYNTAKDMEQHRSELYGSEDWGRMVDTVRPLVLGVERRLLKPSPLTPLSPLFSSAG